MTAPPPRKPFQFHLSTAFLIMCLVGLVLGVVAKNYYDSLPASSKPIPAELKALEFADPVADAKRAISKKDYNLIGFFDEAYSYEAPLLPGVDRPNRSPFGVRTIPGYADFPRLKAMAFNYAEAYNRIVMDAIKTMQ